MSEIDCQLVDFEQVDDSDEMTAFNLLKLAGSVSRLFKSSKPAIKNQILWLTVSNLKIKEKQLSFNLLEPFSIIKKWTLAQYGSRDWARLLLTQKSSVPPRSEYREQVPDILSLRRPVELRSRPVPRKLFEIK